MEIRQYRIKGTVNKRRRIALVADLHDRDSDLVLITLRAMRPDIIAIAGDLTNNKMAEKENVRVLLRKLSAIAPCYYSLGNHEYDFSEKDLERVRDSGAVLLIDEYVFWNELVIGALRSRTKYRAFPEGRSSIAPHCGWLDVFEKQEGYKLLLSHHPEYYEPYLKNRNIDLVLSGHAHGGQMRLFGKALFSPGQGILPKYTRGVYDGKLVVSAGLANTVRWLPRLGNPTELVFIDIEKDKADP